MNNKIGLSIHWANENVFKSGLFECFEFTDYIDFREEDAFELWEKEVDKVCELSKKYNIPILSYHMRFNDERDGGAFPFTPSSPDEAVRDFTLNNSKRLIEYMTKCNIKRVVLHGSKRIDEHLRAECREYLIDYIQKLCDFCAPFGITVALETLKPVCLGNGVDDHLYIMSKVNRDNYGICFDCNHFTEEDNIEFIRKAGQYIVTTHLSDFDGIDERHWIPGKGIIDWKNLVTALDDAEYSGPYIFEIRFDEEVPTSEEMEMLISEWKRILK